MTIIIPRDQQDFDASLARLMEADHPDKRIDLVTDTPYTGFDVPMSLAVAAGFLPEQTEENSTPPPPAPLDGAAPADPEDPEDPDPPAETPADAPAGDGGKSEDPQTKPGGTPGTADSAEADKAADSAADKTTGTRGKGAAGKTKTTDAPAQGAERKGA